MKDFVVIVKSTAGKVDKFQDFDTQAEAETHANDYGGFIVPYPVGGTEYWTVDPVVETVVNDQRQADADLKMREWLADMSKTEASMPQFFEDYIDENGIVLANGRVKDNYEAKQALRARMPT